MSSQETISRDRIRAIDVFSELSDEALDEVAASAQSRSFDEGTELLHRESWPEDMLALEEGEVAVRRHGEDVATLGAGCVVGERGVLHRALRNADVVALTPVRVLFFHRNRVKELRKDLPDIGERLEAIAAERE